MIRSFTGELIEPNEGRFNRDVMFSSKTVEWETPQDVFDYLDKKLGPFTLDVCATPENAKVSKYFTKKDNALIQNWGGHVCWMNPPYGHGLYKWIRKALNESKKPETSVVCLLPAKPDTKYFHELCTKGTIWFVKGRLHFGGAEAPAPFPSMVVIFPSIEKQR